MRGAEACGRVHSLCLAPRKLTARASLLAAWAAARSGVSAAERTSGWTRRRARRRRAAVVGGRIWWGRVCVCGVCARAPARLRACLVVR